MSKYDRETLLKDLRENVAEIFFIKVDGTERRMKCTLLPNILPEQTNKVALEEAHKRPENQETIACWDVEANGWRSFRVDSVKMVQLLDQYQYV